MEETNPFNGKYVRGPNYKPLSEEEREALFPKIRDLAVFLVDRILSDGLVTILTDYPLAEISLGDALSRLKTLEWADYKQLENEDLLVRTIIEDIYSLYEESPDAREWIVSWGKPEEIEQILNLFNESLDDPAMNLVYTIEQYLDRTQTSYLR